MTTSNEAIAGGRRRPVNWRSITLGILGGLFVGTLTPYNNYVLLNTDFIGNHLPASVLMFFLLLVLVVNGLFRRHRRAWALEAGELAVALGMTLVASSLPSVGMMRYLPGHLVSFFHHSAIDRESANLMRQMSLPDWLWPSFEQTDPAARGNDPVVTSFVGRAVVDDPTFWRRFVAVPWVNWVKPLISWGIFLLSLVGTVLFMTLVFRRQWVENERLSFPLASVYISLIEDPPVGRSLNLLLSSRWFWFAFAGVFVLHGFNALSVYYPKHWPSIPLQYNLVSILSEPPWAYAAWGFKISKVYFTIIGLMFLVPGRIAFSLWFFYVAMQVQRMAYGTYQAQFTDGMALDQMFGALVVLGMAALWVARHHLLDIGRQMIGRAQSRGRYLPDAIAGYSLIISIASLVVWLVVAGASVAGAMVIVGVLMLIYIVLARVVAETGLLYVLLPVPAERVWMYASDLSGGALRTTLKSMFFSNWFFGMFQHDTREALPVFATHAVRVADEVAYESERNWRKAFPFVVALVLSLMVGFVVSGASTLYIHYSYATTLNAAQSTVGAWGSFDMPRWIAIETTKQYVPPRSGPTAIHSRVGHFAGGAGFTALLAMMNLRYAAWPLHPVGYLLANTWGLHCIWFSIFLGSLCKMAVVRFGGAQWFRACRPLFIGMIFGEAAAISFWLSVSLVLQAAGASYKAIQILPA